MLTGGNLSILLMPHRSRGSCDSAATVAGATGRVVYAPDLRGGADVCERKSAAAAPGPMPAYEKLYPERLWKNLTQGPNISPSNSVSQSSARRSDRPGAIPGYAGGVRRPASLLREGRLSQRQLRGVALLHEETNGPYRVARVI